MDKVTSGDFLGCLEMLHVTNKYLNNVIDFENVEQLLKNELHKVERFEDIMVDITRKLSSYGDNIEFEYITIENYYKFLKENKLQKKRFTFKGHMKDKEILFNKEHYKIGYNFMVWSLFVPEDISNMIKNLLQSYSALAELSDRIKKSGPRTFSDPKMWTMVCGVNVLYGKGLSQYTKDQIAERLTNWVNNNFKPNYKGDTKMYYKHFETATKQILDNGSAMYTDMSVKQYLTIIPMTGTSGSGYDPENSEKLDVRVNDEKVKYTKNKFTKSCVLSVEQKLEKIYSRKPAKCRASVKAWEFYPKIRLIVSSDYKTFLKMHLIGWWLHKLLYGYSESTLWMNDSQRLEMWLRLGTINGEVAVPIDQKAFDHHYNTEYFKIQMQCIKWAVHKYEQNKYFAQELSNVIDACIESVDQTTIVYEDLVYIWLSGLLSGWGITSDLNTLKNVAEKNVGLRLIKEICDYILELRYFNAQGDDQFVRTSTFVDGLRYYCSLSACGADIHIQKNFFSDEHDEYLRITGTNQKVINGYLPRTIESITWAEEYQYHNPVSRAQEILSVWKKVAIRSYKQLNQLKSYLVSDLAGARIDQKYIQSLFLNPATLGGINSRGLDLNSKEYEIYSLGDQNININLDVVGTGLKQFSEKYLSNQEQGVKNWLISNINMPSIAKMTNETLTGNSVTYKPKPFSIRENIKIGKPNYKTDWNGNAIISVNNYVMKEAFPNIDDYYAKFRAPKSFVNMWACGQLKTVCPFENRYSDVFLSSLVKKYENSMIYAALRKKHRTKDLWILLNLYLEYYIVNYELEKYKEYFVGS